MATLGTCLWFDGQAEEAAKFYTGIFDGKVLRTTRYGKVGQEIHGQTPGSVMTVEFELAGRRFTALNGGPLFKFTEAMSIEVYVDSQEELDRYWAKLGEGGDPKAQQCGWLKDRYGVSWQVVPRMMNELVSDSESPKSQAAFAAMLKMKKLDIAELKRAYERG